MPIPTRRTAVVVAIASIAMVGLGSWAGFLVVNLLVVLIVGADALLVESFDDLVVVRDLPEVVALDAIVPISWEITNRTRRRLVVDIADDLAPSLRARTRRVRASVPADGVVTLSTKFRPARRGRFEIRELVVRIEGPFGLAARQRARQQLHVLRVYPTFRSRDEAELRINSARMLEIGLRTAQGRGGGTEFDQLREYSPDDEFKKIDWAATARAGKAIVRTYRAERNQTVISLLDNGRVMAARVDDVPKVEHAMDAVMCLTSVATRLGDRAGFVSFDAEVRSVVPPGHGRHQLGRVTEAMYALEPQLVESDYFAAFSQTLARFRRRAMLVLYTDLVEQAVAETLLPALPLISRSHIVVIASVQDPDVVRWERCRPTNEVEAYRKAAAITALEERRRITARLRGLGATVVDAPPGLLAGQLADAYLKVKATGRL